MFMLLANNSTFGMSEYKAQLDGLSGVFEELEKEQEKLENEIANAQNEQEKQEVIKNQLDSQITNLTSQVTVLSDKITLLEDNLQKTEIALQQKEESIEANMDMFLQRVYAMYTTPPSSTIGLILGADSFAEMLTAVEFSARVAEQDNELLEIMKEELEGIEEDKRIIEEDKLELETSKTDLQDKQGQLSVQLSQTNAQIQDLAALEAEYKKNQAAISQELKEVNLEIEAIYDKIQSLGEYSGTMTWPVPGHLYISSDFGWRFGGTNYHTGFDIARADAQGVGIYGKPTVAANSGTVIVANSTYVQGRGYGIYVIVDHGGGISTLYGHLSKLAVSTGDTVTKGETIGYVGSTGWSTGPHLHFEVRKDGVYVYPWDYIARP